MFKWSEATVDEMARHIATIQSQPVTALLHYYRKHNNEKMLTAIEEARILAKRYRAVTKVAALVEEYGLQGVENDLNSTQRVDGMGDGKQRA